MYYVLGLLSPSHHCTARHSYQHALIGWKFFKRKNEKVSNAPTWLCELGGKKWQAKHTTQRKISSLKG